MSGEQSWGSPKEVGLYLKRCREERGISLLDISELTKISPQLLRAMEEGQWERLYSSFFLVSFLKAYCRMVGISCESIVKYAEKFLIPVEKKRGESYRKLLYRRAPILPNRGKIVFYVTVIFISFLMLFGGLFLSNRGEKSPGTEVAKTLENPVDVPQEVVRALKISSEPNTSKGDNAPGPRELPKDSGRSLVPPNYTANTEGVKNRVVEAGVSLNVHRLVIEATGETWVRVWLDDKDVPISILMTEGERVDFEVKERAKVKLSNAAGARVVWDDQAFEHLGRKGRVITLSFPKNSTSSKKHVR